MAYRGKLRHRGNLISCLVSGKKSLSEPWTKLSLLGLHSCPKHHRAINSREQENGKKPWEELSLCSEVSGGRAGWWNSWAAGIAARAVPPHPEQCGGLANGNAEGKIFFVLPLCPVFLVVVTPACPLGYPSQPQHITVVTHHPFPLAATNLKSMAPLPIHVGLRCCLCCMATHTGWWKPSHANSLSLVQQSSTRQISSPFWATTVFWKLYDLGTSQQVWDLLQKGLCKSCYFRKLGWKGTLSCRKAQSQALSSDRGVEVPGALRGSRCLGMLCQEGVWGCCAHGETRKP